LRHILAGVCQRMSIARIPVVASTEKRKEKNELTTLKLTGALLAAVLLVAACGSASVAPGSPAAASVELAPSSALSPEIQRLPSEIQEVYRFALANPDVLDKIPCYCGCNQIGHTSNLMCYVESQSADGKVVFDSHGAG
jgi:hypothetical protein